MGCKLGEIESLYWIIILEFISMGKVFCAEVQPMNFQGNQLLEARTLGPMQVFNLFSMKNIYIHSMYYII